MQYEKLPKVKNFLFKNVNKIYKCVDFNIYFIFFIYLEKYNK